MNIELPTEVEQIINRLKLNEFQAYIVGGCVRDIILGKIPKDWDITTNALPEQVIKIFADYKTIPIGIEFGTVAVIINNIQFEITTFRVDGKYSDSRHPDKVLFSNILREDLSRRDFTINAIAYNHEEGLIDYFCGINDIENKIIRCIGDPYLRFQEDPLRMMRAIRFMVQLGFNINLKTQETIFYNNYLLRKISRERIRDEFIKIILSNNCSDGLYKIIKLGIMEHICPQFIKCNGFNQLNPYHIYDVEQHIIKSVEIIQDNLILRLTMFFHDIGKPECLTIDKYGGHFYGHSKISSEIARQTMNNLNFDNETISVVCNLVLYHDIDISLTKKSIRKILNSIGEKTFYYLMIVRMADILAQNLKYSMPRIDKIYTIKKLFDEIILNKECFTRKSLAIDGNDLINAGIKEGTKIGIILNQMLDLVIENPELNTKEFLLSLIDDRMIVGN